MKTNCWFWPRCKDKKGYGRIWNGESVIFAHHFLWELANGRSLPLGQCVLHACDNPSCVNPEHLFLGTHKENMADMASKGRSILGERHPSAKLTVSDVLEIRALAKQGMRQREIGLKYGVNQNCISRIVSRARWKHIL